MNRIELGCVLYRQLRRRENELENEIKKLERLKRELEELQSLIHFTKNYHDEIHGQNF